MKTRTRLFLAFLLVVALGFYLLIDWVIEDLRPRYLETMEESMVDTATILSSFMEQQMNADGIEVTDIRAAFLDAQRKRFSAKIFEVTKTHLNMRVYITDDAGIVLFDSDEGKDEGKDYSEWNDVVRTLRGEYGARATLLDPDDPKTTVLHVASPIRSNGEIVGVLTVCKPADSVTLFIKAAKRKIAIVGIAAAIAVALLGMVISSWVTWPIQKLTAYANAVRDGKRVAPPQLGRSEIGELGAAFEQMRDALEGKQYVENYVQTLTHEMKSPLSAIRGAAELLREDMSPDKRQQFLDNVRHECFRIQDLIDRLLELSSLENRKELRDTEEFDVFAVTEEVIGSLRPMLKSRRLEVKMMHTGEPVIKGERFLVRQAISNLIKNAAEFSPPNETIAVSVDREEDRVRISITDNGPGLPHYALGKAFDRFYSLTRPDSGKKSSGLGLTFVQEVANLHEGEVRLENADGAGARATLILPTAPSESA